MSTDADGPTELTLAKSLRLFESGDKPLETDLKTSERVLARVTDGIYRRPGSALRELISNAYDADATKVVINTDRPRFERITITDDGIGIGPEVLEHLLHNIGGSVKRTDAGARLKVTSEENNTRSRAGRPLIGKIGIGLFSVAQLTQSFQIVSKVAGDNFQSVASVVLKQYSDSTTEVDDEGRYKAGRVLLWTEPAPDIDNHGTTITLTAVRSQTRQALRSHDLWEKLAAADKGDGRRSTPPLFHIGVMDASAANHDLLELSPALPYRSGADGRSAFRNLTRSPLYGQKQGRRKTDLSSLLDDYLLMVWNLALAAPLPYVADGPFDLGSAADCKFFLVNGQAGAEPTKIELASGGVLRDHLPFDAPVQPSGFDVFVDDMKLSRPLSFEKPPETTAALQQPMVFVGNYRTEFASRDLSLSGGPLEFSCYFYWAAKLVPADRAGLLIRVNEASGTSFEKDFLGFPVNEERRLSQISCEVFIKEGFDGALNIDRESFNLSHPHVITLTRWIHGALRQVIATQKRLGAEATRERRTEVAIDATQRVQQIVEEAWSSRGLEEYPTPIRFEGVGSSLAQTRGVEVVKLPASILGQFTGSNWPARQAERADLMEAVGQVMMAFGLLEDLDQDGLVELIATMNKVLSVYVK